MIFTQGLIFQYGFFLLDDNDKNSYKVSVKDVNDWCNANLSGQWMILDNSHHYSRHESMKIVYQSRASHASPLMEYDYPPAQMILHCTTIIAIETEEDATAFKLRWDQTHISP